MPSPRCPVRNLNRMNLQARARSQAAERPSVYAPASDTRPATENPLQRETSAPPAAAAQNCAANKPPQWSSRGDSVSTDAAQTPESVSSRPQSLDYAFLGPNRYKRVLGPFSAPEALISETDST